MDDEEPNKLRNEFMRSLEGGDAANATPEQLQRWITGLCLWTSSNERLHPGVIVQGLTVNHIQMARTIDRLEETIKRLDAANGRTQRLVIILTVVVVVLGVIQTAATLLPFFR